MKSKPLVLCALPLGYGPVSKLLAVAESLNYLGIRPVFLGSGIALELASRSPFFCDVIEGTASDEDARRVIGDAGALCSFMDQAFSALAVELSRPLFVVDSLFWMRRSVPESFLAARRYWVQNFPGIDSGFHTGPRRFVYVGPIISERMPPPPSMPKLLVVNLGGYSSPYTDGSSDLTYAKFVCRGLYESGLMKAFSGKAVVMGGERCIRALRDIFGDREAAFGTFAHEEAVSFITHASLLYTSPGITSTLEGFHAGTPVFFLPPQSYSQWLILRVLRECGLAPCSFHWEDQLQDTLPQEIIPVSERRLIVRSRIHTLANEEGSRAAYSKTLSASLLHEKGDLVNSQSLWFNSLGTNGSRVIAEELAAMLP